MSRFAYWATICITTCGLLTHRSVFLNADDTSNGGNISVRLSATQVRGTHNSYHLAPDAVAERLIRLATPQVADSIAYSHRTLSEQFDKLGIRQIELDLYLDPEGGAFARPVGYAAAEQQKATVPPHDPAGKLNKPGIKVLHSPDFDFRTTVYTLIDALTEVGNWSAAHPKHYPIFVLLELKADSFSPVTRPVAWNSESLAAMEKEILHAIPRERLLTPDDVRGNAATLRDAIRKTGWPTLESSRGKIILLLDNENSIRDEYLRPSDTLANRLLFVSVTPAHPAAAWMKRNDPVSGFEEIQSLVRDGFLVRTRADVGTDQARKNDPSQREKAFATGAQLISSDFPEPDHRFSEYSVQFPNGIVVRSNPVSGSKELAGKELE